MMFCWLLQALVFHVECSKPITIEAIDVIQTNHGRTDINVHKHSQIGGTVRGLVKPPYAWDWLSEIVQVTGAVLTRILGTYQWLESLLRKFLSHSS